MIVTLNKGILETSADAILQEYGPGDFVHLDDRVRKFVNVYLDTIDDAPHLGFRLFFHFSKNQGLLASENYTNSALAFLKRIGDESRYQLLKTFIRELSALNSENAWVFHGIEGIETVLNRKKTDHALRESRVTINCYETVEFRIQALIRLYREISFDYNRRVFVLPSNLRKFSMSVYIYDCRVAYDEPTNLGFENPEVTKVNHMLLDLGGCEINDESGNLSVGNVDLGNGETQLIIDFNRSGVSGLFKTIVGQNEVATKNLSLELFTTAVTQNRDTDGGLFSGKLAGVKASVQKISSAKDVIIDPEYWKTTLQNVRTGTEASLLNDVENVLNGLYLGNVSGLSISNLETSLLDGEVGNAAIAVANGLRSTLNKEVGLKRYLSIE